MTRKQQLASMVRRARRLVQEVEQMIIDAESWNENHPNEKPMDIEGERVLLPYLREHRDCLIRGDTIAAATVSRDMERIAQANVDFDKEMSVKHC